MLAKKEPRTRVIETFGTSVMPNPGESEMQALNQKVVGLGRLGAILDDRH